MNHCIYICTPWYRKYPLMDKTITSVLTQTYDNIKWTIIDNSEDFFLTSYFDDFFNRHSDLEKNRSKVHIIPIKSPYTIKDKNLAGYYKNIAINLCGATDDDFIMMLDSDDYLDKGIVEELVEIIDNDNNIEFVSGSFWLVDYCDINTGEMLKHEDYCDSHIVFAKSIKTGTNWYQFPKHPICFKKGPFLAITGGYDDSYSHFDDSCEIKAKFKLRNTSFKNNVYHSIIYTNDANYSNHGDFYNGTAKIADLRQEYAEHLLNIGVKDFPTVDY